MPKYILRAWDESRELVNSADFKTLCGPLLKLEFIDVDGAIFQLDVEDVHLLLIERGKEESPND